jgi:hypothetical protein
VVFTENRSNCNFRAEGTANSAKGRHAEDANPHPRLMVESDGLCTLTVPDTCMCVNIVEQPSPLAATWEELQVICCLQLPVQASAG